MFALVIFILFQKLPPLNEKTYVTPERYIKNSFPHYGKSQYVKTYADRRNGYIVCKDINAKDVKVSLNGRPSGYVVQTAADPGGGGPGRPDHC